MHLLSAVNVQLMSDALMTVEKVTHVYNGSFEPTLQNNMTYNIIATLCCSHDVSLF